MLASATSGPHLGHERPDRSGQQRSPLAHPLPSSAPNSAMHHRSPLSPRALRHGRDHGARPDLRRRLGCPIERAMGPPVQIVVAKVPAAAPGQQTGSNRCP
jgi:hypothetical protein